MSRSAPYAAFAAALTLAGLVTFRHAAASPSARLVYVRGRDADSCPGEADLRKAVAARLGYDPFFPAATKTVVAQITRVPKGFRARVQIVGDDGKVRGERDLASPGDDCTELVAAVALAVSLALDDLDDRKGEGTDDQPHADVEQPPSAGESAVAEIASPSPVRPLVPRVPDAAGKRIEVAASAAPTLTFGTAPAAAVGVNAAFAVRYEPVSLRLDLRADLPATATFAPGGRVSTQSVVGALTGCVRAGSAIRPFVCAGAGFGSFTSRTDGLARSASDSARLTVLVGRVGVEIPVTGRLYVEPDLEVFANLSPHRVEVDGATIYRLPGAGVTVGVHLGVRIF